VPSEPVGSTRGAPARALREQVDWDGVRDETGDTPFAEALLFLLERIDVCPPRAVS
jgi:hypothetical protein